MSALFLPREACITAMEAGCRTIGTTNDGCRDMRNFDPQYQLEDVPFLVSAMMMETRP